MPRNELISQLSSYSSIFQYERALIPRFLSLLKYPNCFERSLLFGHVTASAWITDAARTKVLLLHHAKLDRWLQPGGHADGEENVSKVAIKEMTEETGLKNFHFAHPSFFDLDINIIPQRKEVHEHEHYDFRFHFIAVDPSEIVKNNESLELKWVTLDNVSKLVGNEQSIMRMLEKTK